MIRDPSSELLVHKVPALGIVVHLQPRQAGIDATSFALTYCI